MTEATTALVQRTLELAQEMKLAMGGRTSDPVNPNFLMPAAMIAMAEDDAREDGVALANDDALLAQYREGYGDAFRWVLSNIDLDPLDKDRLEKALDAGPEAT